MQFVKESFIPAPVEAVFAFHERPDALLILSPPFEKMEVVQPPKSLEVGTVVIVKSKIGPVWTTIVAEHVGYRKNEYFEDTQRRGPFARWFHRHLFIPKDGGTLLRDEIDYAPPLGFLGRLVDPVLVRPRLEKMFEYRHEVTRREVLAGRSNG